MKIDAAVMTYNSEKYLDSSLSSLKRAIPLNRLIVVDHYSTDGTIKIAKSHGAEIHQEAVGLGYARQIAIGLVETPVFFFHDSDVEYYSPYNWADGCIRELLREKNLASIVAKVSYTNYPSPRAKYVRYWHEKAEFTQLQGFTTGSTFIKKECLEGLRIPEELDAREDRFIELFIQKKNLGIKYLPVQGMHYFDHAEKKGAWAGANERLLSRFSLNRLFHILARRVFTAPLKAIPPMFAYRDPEIFFWNTKHWWSYLQGYLKPLKYRKLVRG
ncbi:glycosyltransferase family 2 protein [Candidatus Bathyarchaeota archaeon]|nr:glycosyltransferase family 2 protein [Candidatus Bathyarchaeota archaeon]MBS7631010.1 glycosyltransferase family 2 protein [Candidatus Bathyarchaeota archaeon]